VLWPNAVWGQPDRTGPLAAAAQAMALAKIGDTRPWAIIAMDSFFSSTISVSASGGYDVFEHWSPLGCARQLEALRGHQ